MDEIIKPRLKRFCMDCSLEFAPASPQTRLCFRCGGPPEALPPSQPCDVVRVYDQKWLDVSDIAFMADGKHAVVNSIESHECENPYDDHGRLPDVRMQKFTLGLWELEGFTRLKIYNNPQSSRDDVRAGLSLSKDNRFALTGTGYSHELPLYDLESEKKVRTFRLNGYSNSVCITPDGSYAIAGDNIGVVWLWELSSGLSLRKLEGEPSCIAHTALLSNTDQLITVTERGELRQWGLRSGECVALQQTQGKIQAVVRTPDDQLLFSTDKGSINQWNPRASTAVAGVFRKSTIKQIFVGEPGCATTMALTADGNAVLIGGKEGILRLIELSSGRFLRAWQLPPEYAKPITCLALSPDGKHALAGAGDQLHLWGWVEPLGVKKENLQRQPQVTESDDPAQLLLNLIANLREPKICRNCKVDVSQQANSDGRAVELQGVVDYLCPTCAHGENRTNGKYEGDYLLLRLLGQSVLSYTYRAWHAPTCRVVILEYAKPDPQMTQFIRDAFLVKSRMDRLKHPNLLRLINVSLEQEISYWVWEEFAGASADVLAAHSGGTLPYDELFEIALRALDGLGYLHSQRWVHRDIKPSNLLVKKEGKCFEVKITGFDLVFALNAGEPYTRVGEFSGTFPFMPREQLLDFGNARTEWDLYALGATLYNLLTGQFVLDFPAAGQGDPVRAILEGEPVPIRQRSPSIPPELAQVVDKAVSMKPEDRYQNAAQFKAHLLAAMQSIHLTRTITKDQFIQAQCAVCKTDLSAPASADGRGVELKGLVYHLCPDCVAKGSELEERPGEYALMRKLEEMGDTGEAQWYKAWHPFTCRVVNLERMSLTHHPKNHYHNKMRIGKALRQLSHPNLLQLIDYGQGEMPYRIWESYDGQQANTLAEQAGGKMPIMEALEITLQTLDGLGYLHNLGWLHHDIKPGILLVKKENEHIRVKITYFDLMDNQKLRSIEDEITDGVFAGTLPYMPGEQITGFSFVTPASDLYAVGATLYNLLTGQFVLNFPAAGQGDPVRTILEGEPVPIRQRGPSIPPVLAQIVDKAVSKKAKDRYQSTAQFKAHLLAVMQSIRLTRTIMMDQMIEAECSVCRTDLSGPASADGLGTELSGLVYHLCPGCAAKESTLEKRLGEYVLLDQGSTDTDMGSDTIFHKAWHPFTCRVFNLELAHPEHGPLKSYMYKRMLRISYSLQQFSHPNLLQLIYGGDAEDTSYWVWEAFDGIDTSALVERSGGTLNSGVACAIILQALDALSYLHRSGWIHNRLEPKNILVKEMEGRYLAKISGFDLIDNPDKQLHAMDMAEDECIEVNQVFKPLEQLYRITGTPTSDIYALGASLYYLLTGQYVLDFALTEDPLMQALEESRVIREGEPVPIRQRDPSIPPVLAQVVDKAVRKKAEDRYQSATEFKNALQTALLAIQSSKTLFYEPQTLFQPAETRTAEILTTRGRVFCIECCKDLTQQADSDGHMWEYKDQVFYLCAHCAQDQCKVENPAFGNYLLLNELGMGNMGTVFRAWHRPTCRVVTLKKSYFFDTADSRKRFSDAIKPLLPLNHRFLVRVFDSGVIEKFSFVVSEHMEEGDLWSLLEKKAPLPPDQMLPWALELLEALTYMHAKPFVHGNLHARNILMGRRYNRQVMKICVADWMSEDRSFIPDPEYDPPDPSVPYLYWMAHDQIFSWKHIRPHQDCYSLAAWFYYSLSGQPALDFSPQRGYDPLRIILEQAPIPLRQRAPQVPEALASAIDRALSIDPQERFPDAGHFLDALRTLDLDDREGE